LQSDEDATRWLARLEFLRKAMQDADLPKDAEGLARQALPIAAEGKRSLEDVRRGLLSAMQDLLPYPSRRLMETEAPETIQVPTGNRIKLDYPRQGDEGSPIQPPVLAVRLQELFGMTQTPRVAGGRVAVRIHLLGPNFRPVQITDDLKSFWSTTYFQVRKDLRVRYPKHAWPEDPLTATPQAKGGRRNR
jgi:ATP-dependent helicase HrpB